MPAQAAGGAGEPAAEMKAEPEAAAEFSGGMGEPAAEARAASPVAAPALKPKAEPELEHILAQASELAHGAALSDDTERILELAAEVEPEPEESEPIEGAEGAEREEREEREVAQLKLTMLCSDPLQVPPCDALGVFPPLRLSGLTRFGFSGQAL